MKKIHPNPRLLSLVALCALAGSAHSQIVNQNQTFTADPAVENEYHFTNPAGNTWTIDGNITVGNGTTADSRVFVGINGDSGKLTLNGANGTGDILFLNGYHPADPGLGRLGHVTALGTLNIDGGLAVTMGGRLLRFAGAGTNTINIVDGSLNYTTANFGWQEVAGNSFVNHVIGAGGSLIVPGIITNAAGFTSWAVTSGTDVEAEDIFVSPGSGFTLSYANNGVNTTITAVPAPILSNSTTFDGTEATFDGNLSGYANPGGGAGFDTVNGWTWGTDDLAATGGPLNGGVFGGLGTIRDQEIRTFELQTGLGNFSFGYGGTGTQTALARGFTAVVGTTVTVTYDMSNSNGGMYLYVDNGSGTYGSQDHVMSNGTAQTYSFVATGTAIRIAVRANDGVDSDALLESIAVAFTTANSYSAWATVNAGSQTPEQDFDHDGVANGVEFFMGQTGSSFTATPPLVTTVGVRTQTWARDPNVTAPFKFQVSENLSGWTDYAPPHANINTSNPNQVTFTLPGGPTKQFCRLVVTP